ncbi:MAG: hypothetical protein ABIG67_09485 [Pseudomonadota bacterium]
MKDYEMDLGHVRPEQVTFDELAEDLRTEYRIEGRKSLDRLGNSITHLEKVFKGMRAMEINTARVKRYIALRQGEGAQNGTINRQLAAFSKMFNLGAGHTPEGAHCSLYPEIEGSERIKIPVSDPMGGTEILRETVTLRFPQREPHKPYHQDPVQPGMAERM